MDRPVTPETFHLFMTFRLNGPAPDKWTGKNLYRFGTRKKGNFCFITSGRIATDAHNTQSEN